MTAIVGVNVVERLKVFLRARRKIYPWLADDSMIRDLILAKARNIFNQQLLTPVRVSPFPSFHIL